MSQISHLYNSRITVFRLSIFTHEGTMSNAYLPHPELTQLCRIDTVLLRPGRAGRFRAESTGAGTAPGRTGIIIADVGCGLLAKDIITAVENDFGEIPVPGTFEIAVIPDVIVGYSAAHHVEFQIAESSQALLDDVRPYPGYVVHDELGPKI